MEFEDKNILYHTILHSYDCRDNGLLFGKMGIALALATYAKKNNCQSVEDFAEELLNKVLRNITKQTTIFFGRGLAGIGWGIEYLAQNNFMQINTAEICKEIDDQIMKVDFANIMDLSLENGLLGLLTYINAHLVGNPKKIPFEADFLNTLLSNPIMNGKNLDLPMQKQISIFKNLITCKECSFNLSLNDYIVKQNINLDRTHDLSLRTGYAGKLVMLN